MSQAKVKVNGVEQDMSLEEIAGLDMNEFAEVRGFEALPKGLYLFEITECELGMHEGEEKNQPIIKMGMKVLAAELTEGNNDDVIDKIHNETFWLSDLNQGVGRFKAILVDSGFSSESPDIRVWIAECVGHQLQAMVAQRTAKNDKDKKYAYIDQNKVGPAQ